MRESTPWDHAVPLRAALLGCLVASLIGVADRSAAQEFATSAYSVPVALPACDTSNPEVRIISQGSHWAAINDPGIRVFCVRPGNYSAVGVLLLEARGTADRPRVIRYYDPQTAQPLHPVKQASTSRAIVLGFKLRGANYWVIDGISVRGSSWISVQLLDSNYNLFNRLLVEDAVKNHFNFHGISSHNVVQNSVLRRTSRSGSDSPCLGFASPDVGQVQRNNRIVQNEISECTDGFALHLNQGLANGGRFPGMVIDENDIYLTPARYSNCNGVLDPRGPCACAENGIDVKIGGVDSSPEGRVTISNNRVWGWRQTDTKCGGSGSWGDAIALHRVARYVAVMGNRVLDGPRGISLGGETRNVALVDNVLHRLRGVNGAGFSMAIGGYDTEIRGNRVVDSAMWLGVASDHTLRTKATCNVLVESGGAGGNDPATGSLYDLNAYYATPSGGRFAGPNDLVYASTSQASLEPLCFWRKRWTTPERVCVPYGSAAGPIATCGGTLGTPAAPRLLDF